MRDTTQLHPTLQDKITELTLLCAKNGINIKIGECFRTVAEQDELYAQGRTKPGNKVTNAKGSTYSSQHQWGIAFDFYINMDVDGDGNKTDDAFNNSTGLFDKVGALAKSIGLAWGGDWKSPVDKPHLYLPDWGKTTTKLKNTYGTFEEFKKTWARQTLVVGKLADRAHSDGNWYYTDQYGNVIDIITVAKNINGWWYVYHGKVDFSYNGIAENENGIWIIENGKVTFSYNGEHKQNGYTFIVKDSKVIGTKEESEVEEYDMKTIRVGSSGKAVKIWQIIIGATPDGVFGNDTKNKTIAFQRSHGLVTDGVVGRKSWKVGLESC